MRLDKGLRLSTYLTVALAGASLAYAEVPFFPGFTLVAALMGFLLITAYIVEGSWSISSHSANGIAIVISLGWIIWVSLFATEFDDPLSRSSWTTMVLPYLGPLLMVLVLVKLFRPKGIRDYWYLHLLGLIEIALGSVLVVEAEFALWLMVYIGCAFWSMSIFYLHRASLGTAARVPYRIPGRHLGIWSAARWTGVATILGLVLFMMTPQHGTTEAITDLRSHTELAQTGFSTTAMDLNTAGRLEVDESAAFEVYVENADRSPKADFSLDTRWRGMVLDHYKQGRWAILPGSQMNFTKPNKQKQLPHIGPDEFFINYHINTAQSHGLFLAEPVVVGVTKEPTKIPLDTLPYIPQTLQGRLRPDQGIFNYLLREDYVASLVPMAPVEVTYRQVALPSPPDGMSRRSPLSPENRVAGLSEISLTHELLDQPVSGIREFTKEVLAQMVKEGKLTESDLRRAKPPPGRDPESQSLIRVNRAKVAHALCDYLAYSGEYSYTLNLTRQDLKLDPAEDYLRNVKQGHCEVVATALVLMLRSAGIPSRLVTGFRGADPKGTSDEDDGWYVIRQSHAHAWVEALVGVETIERAGFRQPVRRMELRWLTLDPSAQVQSDDHQAFSWSLWRENILQQIRIFWRVYVLEYNSNKQVEAAAVIWSRSGLEALADRVRLEPYWLAGFAVVVVGLVSLRPVLKRRRGIQRIEQETAFYHRFLSLIARTCRLAPKGGQTPKEFGQTVQDYLTRHNMETDLAGLPSRIIQLFYQVRFGRMPLSSPQREEIDRQLDLLGATLKKLPRLAN
jgi:hypothetical protein